MPEVPKFSVKPKFNFLVSFFGALNKPSKTLYNFVFIIVFFIIYCGVTGCPIERVLGFLALVLAAYMFSIIFNKLSYDRTEYKFFDDRLEFTEGFLTVNKKIVSLTDIKEINLHISILQKQFSLGSIYLGTAATGLPSIAGTYSYFSGRSSSSSGISLTDIENPEDTYAKISQLMQAAKQPG